MNRLGRRILGDAVMARLGTIANLSTYRGEVPATPPTISTDDLRVKPYAVFYPTGGLPGFDPRLGGDSNGLSWKFQITCVSGRESDVEQLVDVVANKFELWTLVPNLDVMPADLRFIGRCRQINDPPPAQRDDAPTPARFWSALLYEIPLTA